MTGRLLAALLVGAIVARCTAATPTPFAAPTPIPEQPDCRASQPRPLCVVILGDSIAAGVPVGGDGRWWVRLQSLLSAVLKDHHVVVDSWAVPGSMVDVLESSARDQPALDSYDVAIVIEGVNDESRLAIDEWKTRYGAAIASMERKGLLVVVGTPPPGLENGAFTIRYDPVAAAIREIAGERRPILDLAKRWHSDGAAVAAAYYADLIHQSAAGQRLMAEMARDVMLQWIGGR